RVPLETDWMIELELALAAESSRLDLLVSKQPPVAGPTESFWLADGSAWRRIVTDSGGPFVSPMPWDASRVEGPVSDSEVERSFLRSPRRPKSRGGRGTVRVVDLFSGCGGLTLGVSEACRALDLACEAALAVDVDPVALQVYGANFPESRCLRADIDR